MKLPFRLPGLPCNALYRSSLSPLAGAAGPWEIDSGFLSLPRHEEPRACSGVSFHPFPCSQGTGVLGPDRFPRQPFLGSRASQTCQSPAKERPVRHPWTTRKSAMPSTLARSTDTLPSSVPGMTRDLIQFTLRSPVMTPSGKPTLPSLLVTPRSRVPSRLPAGPCIEPNSHSPPRCPPPRSPGWAGSA